MAVTKDDDRNQRDSAISGLIRRDSPGSTLPSTSLATIHDQHGDSKLLRLDLKQYQGNALQLYEICIELQAICNKQKTQIDEFLTKAEPLSKSHSRSTRKTTDDSEFSKREMPVDTRIGIAIVFSSSDNGLTVRQLRGMEYPGYIKAELPSFHWWSDTLHIYYEKRSESSSSTLGQPQVFVLKKKLEPDSKREAKFIRTIKLGQLGIGIKLQRILGRLKVLYVIPPQSPRTNST